MKEIIILQDERIINYLNNAGHEERGGSFAYVRPNMLIDFKNKWWWQTHSRITTPNEEIETIIKGQQHWKNMPILETKGGYIDSETLKGLIDNIVSDVWINAANYYNNQLNLKQMDVIKYNHHGTEVSVIGDLKGKHREHCLCFGCKKFTDSSGKCKIAEAVFKNCKDFNIVSPVWECPEFE